MIIIIVLNTKITEALIFLVLGVIIGLFLPRISSYMITYKCRRKNRDIPEMLGVKKIILRVSIVIFMAAVSVLASIFTPVWQTVFLIFFITISIIVVITDHYIRIIPNECVLILFVSGIIYRIILDGAAGFLDSLTALGINILFFGGSAGVFYLIKKQVGLGAGDLKLSMAVAVIVGFPGVLYFIVGTALAMLAYIIVMVSIHMFNMQNYFPMAAHLSAGFLIALLLPYIDMNSIVI